MDPVAVFLHALRLTIVAVVIAFALRFALLRLGWWRPLEAGVGRATHAAHAATLPLLLWAIRLLPEAARLPAAALVSDAVGEAQRGLQRLYAFLDRRIFPPVVAYFAHPLHIAFLLLLGVLLLSYHDPVFELVAGNYTNIGSCLVAIIILYRDRKAEAQTAARHSETTDAVAQLHTRHDQHASEQAEMRAALARVEAKLEALAVGSGRKGGKVS